MASEASHGLRGHGTEAMAYRNLHRGFNKVIKYSFNSQNVRCFQTNGQFFIYECCPLNFCQFCYVS